MRQTWRSGEELNSKDECKVDLKVIATIIGFLPYWFRFAQCLNKYFMATGHAKVMAHMQLYNAGKYSTSIATHVAGIWVTKHQTDTAFKIYLTIKLISTTYSCVWDFYVDWGMFRSTKKGKNSWMLRD